MGEATQAEQDAIDVLFEQAEKTFKARDLDGFVDCFDDNAVCMPPDQHPVIGKEAWRKWLSAWWDSMNVLELSATYHVDIDGDWAIEWHTERMVTIPAEGGDQSVMYSKGIWALRRQADNSWKIARYCWNGWPGPQ